MATIYSIPSPWSVAKPPAILLINGEDTVHFAGFWEFAEVTRKFWLLFCSESSSANFCDQL
jgi:hypothetical protein